MKIINIKLIIFFTFIFISYSYSNSPLNNHPEQNIKESSPPIYAQEYHIVFRTPTSVSGIVPEYGNPWQKWGNGFCFNEPSDPEQLYLKPWRRKIGSIGYPLIGTYDSRNQDIIRWQIQTAKNSGLSGLFVSLFFNEDGSFRSDLLNILENILNISQEESFKIGILDEANFENDNAKKLSIMTNRAIRFIQDYGHHPAYLKINDQPVYNFNFYSHLDGWSPSDLEQFYSDVEAAVGDVYWILQTGEDPNILNISELDAVQHQILPVQYVTTLDSINWEEHRNDVGRFVSNIHSFGKSACLNPFVGFNDVYLPNGEMRIADRDSGEFILNQLSIGKDEGIDFFVIAAFNEWNENSQFEPGWDFDDYNGDPYQYCKIFADFTGNLFTPAPLPPKESVDQLMWGKLYGIDKAGPLVTNFFINNNFITIHLEDDFSNIAAAEYFVDGYHWIRLKNENESSNLRQPNIADGQTSVITKGGREARSTDQSDVYYIYIDDTEIVPGDYNVYISVEYFDEDIEPFRIEYHSTSHLFECTNYHYKTNTQTWCNTLFYLNHAAFGSGQWPETDFRLFQYNGSLTVARIGVILIGEGFPLYPTDGIFDSSSEEAYAIIPYQDDHDLHGIYLHGKDDAGNWGISWIKELTYVDTDSTTKVIDRINLRNDQFYLYPNYPNPFNATTTINYELIENGNVKLVIYNLKGEIIDLLVDEFKFPGKYEVVWNADNVTSGVYFYKLISLYGSETRKFLLIK